MATAHFDVAVLGVGAMGSAACYHLARRGARVVGLEQHGIGHDRGSSHGETRLIRQAYFEHPDYVPLLARAFDLWDALASAAGEPLLHRTGLVAYGPGQGGEVLPGILDSAARYGIPVEAVDGPDLARRWPHVVPPAGYRAVHEPGAGWLAVEACVRAHVRLATAAGAEIRSHTRVLSWTAGPRGVEIDTETGLVHADRLILAAGAYSGPALAELGIGLAVHRNLLFWLETADPTSRSWPCVALDLPEGFFYGFPSLDGATVKIAHHLPGDPVADPAHVDRTLRPDDATAVLGCVARCLPLVAPRVRRHAVCLYEMSRDGHFVLGPHPTQPRVVIAAGFSGHGFKFAAVVGEALADLALQGTTALPIGFLRPDRPGLRPPAP